MSDTLNEALLLRAAKLARGEIQYTDTANAERFLAEHGENVRYCAAWKKWLVWDGMRWDIDETGKIHDLAKTTIRNMYTAASRISDYRDRMEFESHAVKSEAVRRRKNLVEAASWEPKVWVKPEDFDRGEYLLTCRNGTVDLESGELKPHDHGDLITKSVAAAYDRSADCPAWKRFVSEIMDGNENIIRFLQKAAGWALTGDMSEQTMFILYGSGANGKSTFLGTLLDLLGDYAMPTPTETFMRRPGEQLSNDIARLRGTRFVTTIEADQGKRLAEPLIKQITGNDRMTARFLYGEYFDFQPTFKIFMATNHKPVIRGTDYAIWRRIKLIPFTVTIPPEKQDKDLMRKLKAEYSGILSWLLEGCLAWKREGLGTPPEVREATDAYRSDMDVIGNFLKEKCFTDDPEWQTGSREIFKAYQEWCEENNERAGSERLLAFRLQDMGFHKVKKNNGRYWRGIGIRGKEE